MQNLPWILWLWCVCVCVCFFWDDVGMLAFIIVWYRLISLFVVHQSWQLLGLLPLMVIPSVSKAMDLHQHIVFSRALGMCVCVCGVRWWWRQAETGLYKIGCRNILWPAGCFFKRKWALVYSYDSAWAVLRWPMDVCFVSWWRGRTKLFLIRRAGVWNVGDRRTSVFGTSLLTWQMASHAAYKLLFSCQPLIRTRRFLQHGPEIFPICFNTSEVLRAILNCHARLLRKAAWCHSDWLFCKGVSNPGGLCLASRDPGWLWFHAWEFNLRLQQGSFQLTVLDPLNNYERSGRYVV